MLKIIPGIRRIKPPDDDYTMINIPVDTVIEASGLIQEVDENDTVVGEYSSGIIRRDSIMQVRESLETLVVFESLNEAIATVDSSGYVTTVSNGEVQITATNGTTKRQKVHSGQFTEPSITNQFHRYRTGSLGEHILDQIDSLTNSGRVEMSLLKEGEWNEDCWSSSLDWSGVSIRNSRSGKGRGATAISPRHVFMAWHYRLQVGDSITWLDSNGNEVTRSIIAISDQYQTDQCVGLLDNDLPPEVCYYKVMPGDLGFRLTLHDLPQIISTNYNRESILRIYKKTLLTTWAGTGTIRHETNDVFSKDIISGDSGQPVFTVCQGHLILLGTHYTANAFVSISNVPVLEGFYTTNEIMTSLGGGYQLTTVNLSGFPNYV